MNKNPGRADILLCGSLGLVRKPPPQRANFRVMSLPHGHSDFLNPLQAYELAEDWNEHTHPKLSSMRKTGLR
jgi:hypothetical protein